MCIILIAPILSEYLRLPGVVGLVIAGMAIGPFGLHLVAEKGLVENLAVIGLIYLMFSAGLEVNLQQLNRVRNKAIVFGVFTFIIPFIMGLVLGRVIGLEWPGAILFGSAISSHTLLAFPVATRLGIVGNAAVSVTVGATVFTDIAAFLVLAIISGMQRGDASAGQFITLLVLTALYAALILYTLPRLGKLFFRYFSSTLTEFQFILVVLFVAALLAEAIGMHGVVGAFLAGLAINSTLPHHSPVLARILFIGESLFIPVFLIHSGMITDPVAFVTDSRTLLVGISMTLSAYASKFLAAWIIGRLYGYSRDEMLVAFGLSQAQAAVTLPTILVGIEIGLFFPEILGGTMMMILFTSFTSPLIVRRYGGRLRTPPGEAPAQSSIFDRILVSIFNPKTQDNLLTLASILARAKQGSLLAMRVSIANAGRIQGEKTPFIPIEHLQEEGFACAAFHRVDRSPAEGILNAAIEKEATLILMGWRGRASVRENIFGTVLDEVIWKAPAPVMVARLTASADADRRVLLVLPAASLPPGLLDEAFEIAMVIAQALKVPLLVAAHAEYVPLLEALAGAIPPDGTLSIEVLGGDVVREISRRATATDLVLLTTTGTRQRFQSSLGKIPEQVAAVSPASLVVLHYPS